jgi:hypothetical protein
MNRRGQRSGFLRSSCVAARVWPFPSPSITRSSPPANAHRASSSGGWKNGAVERRATEPPLTALTAETNVGSSAGLALVPTSGITPLLPSSARVGSLTVDSSSTACAHVILETGGLATSLSQPRLTSCIWSRKNCDSAVHTQVHLAVDLALVVPSSCKRSEDS